MSLASITRRKPCWLAAPLATSLVACHSPADTPQPVVVRANPPAISPPTIPTMVSADTPYAVSGRVFEAYSGVVADAAVDFFVESAKGGSWLLAYSDQNGQFFGYLPESRITVTAAQDGLVQPCALNVVVRSDLTLEIELVSETTLDSLSPPVPQSAHGATLQGNVFETVNGVRSPITGADIWVEEYDDIAIATTVTDLSGRYFVCNLPPVVGVYVSKPGFETVLISVDTSSTSTMDVALRRL
jgi:hypothetical protein